MLPTLATTSLHAADWVVLSGYLLVLVVAGVVLGRREQKSTSDYFLADRRMPVWAVAVSIIASSLSAATFIGVPDLSYNGDLTYLSTNIGGLIAVVVVAYVFIPAFYKNNCATVYQLLEKRFGPGATTVASGAFMVGRLFASGARIYIAAIPLSMILYGAEAQSSPHYLWSMMVAIAALTVVGTVYALFGGIRSVIWTDVIQTVVLMVAVGGAIAVLWHLLHSSVSDVVDLLSIFKPIHITPGHQVVGASSAGTPPSMQVTPSPKFTVIRWGLTPFKSGLGFDISDKFTVLTAVFGFSLLNIAAYGTDHDLVQRMLTCKNAVQGSKSVLLSMAIGLPIVCSFLLIGLLIKALWLKTSLVPGMGDAAGFGFPEKGVFVRSILSDMPAGLVGLMLAGLFAAGLGSLTSAINAMAATSIKDFYTRWLPNRGERHYLAASKIAVLAWGAALGVFAVLCFFWQQASPNTTLIDLALGVMTFAYAGLLAVFLTALLTRRGNTRSVIAAIVTGFVVITLLQDWAWPHWTLWVPIVGPELAATHIAFPWHMTIGTGIAFLVCVSGRPEAGRSGGAGTVGHCPSCGYALAGLTSGVCPECGGSIGPSVGLDKPR